MVLQLEDPINFLLAEKTKNISTPGEGQTVEKLWVANVTLSALNLDVTQTVNVLKVSDRVLTEDKFCLLSKGLHFCPHKHLICLT